MSMVAFEGKVAIVTGAGRGLGRAYAMALAQRGAHVVVNDLGGGMDGSNASSEAADVVVAAIRAQGGDAVANYDSVAVPAGARDIVRSAVDAFGTVDIVINNAGIFGSAGFHEISLETFKSIIAVHLFGTAGVTHAAWPILRGKRYGRVVMTVSSAGFWGLENSPGYCAAKAGVFGLAKGLSHEGEPFNIKVNMIAPGAKTRATERLFGEKAGWTWRPELVTPAVLYMASEQCRHNGAVFTALAGQYARVEPMQGAGQRFDPRTEIAVEDFVGALDAIEDLTGARSMEHGLSGEIRSTANAPLPG